MAVARDILDALKSTLLLNERVANVAGQLKILATELRDVDKRLVRVEATLDVLTRAAFTNRNAVDVTPSRIEPPPK
jgi:hypothetical protein